MKRKIAIIVLSVLIVVCCVPTVALANMAQPGTVPEGTGFVFDSCESVQVVSEVLDIEITSTGGYSITATYTMQNLTDEVLDIYTVFLLPTSSKPFNGTVTQDDSTLDIDVGVFYYIDYTKSMTTADWQYVLEYGSYEEYPDEEIDAYIYWYFAVEIVEYTLHFEPNGTSIVEVSYSDSSTYLHATNYITYYLTPAQYWADFGTITINLTVASVYPVLYSSSVEFVQISSGVYQYVGSLPDEELSIVVKQEGYSITDGSDDAVDSWWNRVGVTIGTILFWCCLAIAVLATTIIIVVRKIKYKAHGYPTVVKGYYKRRIMIILILLVVLVIVNAVSLSLVGIVGTSMYAVYLVDVVAGFALLSYGILLLDRYIASRTKYN